MPVENFPTYPGSGDPRPALAEYVRTTRNFLDELADTNIPSAPTPSETLFFPSLLEPLRKAWKEARSQFELLALKISELSAERIFDHGLFGDQLAFKFEAVNFLHGRYKQMGKRVLRKLLEAIDTLLGSIIEACMIAKGAKEIKEYFEHSLDDGQQK
jgi:hypothetical protein